ncbi:hypothetical protein INR49_014763 [Caranx melampygus]|nr:hypothetical protein INR49_014763 [Caranx melampygus]
MSKEKARCFSPHRVILDLMILNVFFFFLSFSFFFFFFFFFSLSFFFFFFFFFLHVDCSRARLYYPSSMTAYAFFHSIVSAAFCQYSNASVE